LQKITKEAICHDCGAKEGAIHEYGCDMERCPFCGNQLLSCNCKYKFLGYDLDLKKQYHGLPESVWMNGLSDEEYDKWVAILETKGRVPYIRYPVLCAYCGVLWPDFFMVPDQEWSFYVAPKMQGSVLCRKCYDYIKDKIDFNYRKYEPVGDEEYFLVDDKVWGMCRNCGRDDLLFDSVFGLVCKRCRDDLND